MIVRTRFAPSPTGYLHIGGLRTALYAYLIAKQNNGQFVLRIEDTDQKRTVDGGIENIVRSLEWAGVLPDEGVKMGKNDEIVQMGDFGPYIQSQRLEVYKKYINELLLKDSVYYCFCTQERLEELRNYQQKNKLPTGYDGFCRKLDKNDVKNRVESGENYVIRLKMPKDGESVFTDLIRGEVSFKNELIDDQVLIKVDGFPTYHFAVVVDDHLMGITHVIRGEEWLSSTPKHLQIYKNFGWETPKFAHLPLLLNPDKSKLSKRQGDVAVEDYIKKGYLPQAIINFVAFLGWNPGGEQEIYSMEELVKEFKFERINKSGAVFNLEKLAWYNQQYIKNLKSEDLVDVCVPWLIEAGLVTGKEDRKWTASLIGLEKERITTLDELAESLKFVFSLPEYNAPSLVWKKGTPAEVKEILPRLIKFLNTIGIQDWNKEKMQSLMGDWIVQSGFSNGSVLWPMRVSLSGQQNSPGPYEIAEVLGKEESIRRLEIALDKLGD